MSKIIGIDASRATAAQKTGVEQYAWHVIQELKRVIPSEYRVRLYSAVPLTGTLAELPNHWESVVLGWAPRRLWTQIRLSWEMLRRPPDVLFVPAHVLPPMLPKRSVVTMHDVAFMPHPEAYSPHGNLYLRADARLAVRRASRILTVSEFSKAEIVKWFRADASHIQVTHLGVDVQTFAHVPLQQAHLVAARYGITGPYFLFVGRLERKKNLSGLIRAFRAYKESHPGDAHALLLVGKPGRGYAREMRTLEGWVGAKDVVHPGFVAQQDMAALYSGATALLLPSWYEGFGLPVIEAMACGTPVFASNTTSLPEVGGDAALYADPADPKAIADAMARVADDAALRARLIALGAERVKRFGWAECARGTWEALRAAVES